MSESTVIVRGKAPPLPPPPTVLPFPSLDRHLLDLLPFEAERVVVAKGRRNWPGERPKPSRLLEPRTGIIVVVVAVEEREGMNE